jgi:hypothetical protein
MICYNIHLDDLFNYFYTILSFKIARSLERFYTIKVESKCKLTFFHLFQLFHIYYNKNRNEQKHLDLKNRKKIVF